MALCNAESTVKPFFPNKWALQAGLFGPGEGGGFMEFTYHATSHIMMFVMPLLYHTLLLYKALLHSMLCILLHNMLCNMLCNMSA
jgi:hypothetical protein